MIRERSDGDRGFESIAPLALQATFFAYQREYRVIIVRILIVSRPNFMAQIFPKAQPLWVYSLFDENYQRECFGAAERSLTVQVSTYIIRCAPWRASISRTCSIRS